MMISEDCTVIITDNGIITVEPGDYDPSEHSTYFEVFFTDRNNNKSRLSAGYCHGSCYALMMRWLFEELLKGNDIEWAQNGFPVSLQKDVKRIACPDHPPRNYGWHWVNEDETKESMNGSNHEAFPYRKYKDEDDE